MTTQRMIEFKGASLPTWASHGDTTSCTRVNLGIVDIRSRSNLQFNLIIREVDEYQLVTRVKELLPQRMSEIHVKRLRAKYPQPPATDDPATYEFESRKG